MHTDDARLIGRRGASADPARAPAFSVHTFRGVAAPVDSRAVLAVTPDADHARRHRLSGAPADTAHPHCLSALSVNTIAAVARARDAVARGGVTQDAECGRQGNPASRSVFSSHRWHANLSRECAAGLRL